MTTVSNFSKSWVIIAILALLLVASSIFYYQNQEVDYQDINTRNQKLCPNLNRPADDNWILITPPTGCPYFQRTIE